MAFIGNTVQNQGFIPAVDYFSGNGSTTAFTLSRPVASVAQVEAVISNVVQDPATAYTVSGNTLTFTSAPPSGTNNIYVRYTSLITQVIAPSQGTVGNTQFSSSTTSIPFAAGGPLGGGNASIMKNRCINGDMRIDQRSAGASVTPVNTGQYLVDRWQYSGSQASKVTAQQNAGSITPPVGFINYQGITSSSAYSITSTDYFQLFQPIEGFNTADLGWGTANAKTVTLSFQVYSSLTGTFGGSLRNSAVNRSYPFSYSVSVANTWTTISVTIAGDTTGTWLTTNGVGIYLAFSLGSGTTFSGTAGAWTAGNLISVTGATSVVGTNGATFYITGVQLEVGSSATGFEYVNYQTSLANCQRYYTKSYDTSAVVPTVNTIVGSVSYYVGGGAALWHCPFRTEMRTTPTITTYSYQGTAGYVAGASNSALASTVYQQSTSGFNVYGAGNGGSDFYCNYQASAEL